MSIVSLASFCNQRIRVVTGDITTIEVAAIVNAANSTLMGGGGVDGAIHRAAGPALSAECKKIRAESLPIGLATGKAVITGAGNLPARFVIHTVGPIWTESKKAESDKSLADCYNNSLSLATQHEIQSVAFPAISTGIYGYPKERAACIAYPTVKHYLALHSVPETVYFVFFSTDDSSIFLDCVNKI